LVGLCLPDETNALLERSELPPRRIVPRDPDHRPVYVSEQGAFVGVSGGRLVVRKDGQELTDTRLLDVSQLCVFGHVQISSEALARLWTRGIPVLWFSFGGWLRGWAQGEPSRHVELRWRQVIAHGQGGGDIACRFIAGKIRNSRTLLRRNSRTGVDRTLGQLAALERDCLQATSRAQLMGIEGTAARLYFGEFTQMIATGQMALAAQFDLAGRARRPSPDPLNALLSFCYGLLTKDLVAVCLGVGLDPHLGVLHGSRFGRPSLALDLVEELRPIVADSTAVLLRAARAAYGSLPPHHRRRARSTPPAGPRDRVEPLTLCVGHSCERRPVHTQCMATTNDERRRQGQRGGNRLLSWPNAWVRQTAKYDGS